MALAITIAYGTGTALDTLEVKDTQILSRSKMDRYKAILVNPYITPMLAKKGAHLA